jgi:hypothetical protein
VKAHWISAVPKLFLIISGGLLVLPAWGIAPSVTLTASNVSMSDQGTGTSQFTLASVNGFTGQVNVVCSGPDPGPMGIVLPNCTSNTKVFNVPANGSVSGTMQLTPPWSSSVATIGNFPISQKCKALEMPATAGGLALACLVGLRLRRGWQRWFAVLGVTAAGLVGVGSVTGCIGHGGLAMQPGAHSYEIIGTTPSGVLEADTQFTVTIHQ